MAALQAEQERQAQSQAQLNSSETAARSATTQKTQAEAGLAILEGQQIAQGL